MKTLIFLLALAVQVPTTMDGLPQGHKTKLTSAECLSIYPPDEGGGFCVWYGYATDADAVRFERVRGFERRPAVDHGVINPDGTGEWWAISPYAKVLCACRWKTWNEWNKRSEQYGPDFTVECRDTLGKVHIDMDSIERRK